MGSKKHKKESKKRKHRSRSLSPVDGEERERKRHRKHKDRKKDRSPDVEEVPVDSHLASASASHSRSSSSAEPERRARSRSAAHDNTREKSREKERSRSPATGGGAGGAGGGAQESLSVEETNRLRAKLGLKPLEVAEKPDAEDGKFKDDLGEFYHKPAANLAEQKKTDKIRERLDERKERRKIEQKLSRTALLAAGSDDEDAAAWVAKSRELDKLKREAAKRAAMLDEMDQVFGVSALLEEEQGAARRHAYSGEQLRGLRVAHDLEQLAEERETVLTLADKEVLAEDAEDVLVNVNMVDDERYKKNIEERKKARSGYQAYDDEADVEAAALGLARPVLAKYDDQLTEQRDRGRGFLLGDTPQLHDDKKRVLLAGAGAGAGAGMARRLESLQLPAPRRAADYLDQHEIQAKFKKTKRRGKMRKRAKQEPIDVEEYEAGGAPLDTDDTEVKPEEAAVASGAAVDDEELEPDRELQEALARARRLAQRSAVPKVEELLTRMKQEPAQQVSEEADDGAAMVLDATAEFCRTLGDIPTYGLAGNRDHHAEIMELEPVEAEPESAEEPAGSAWSRVDVDSEKPPDLAAGSSVALDAEPALGAGVAGALQLALSKGYLERSAGPAPRAPRPHADLLAAAHYSIEDKSYGEDDKYGRRERGGGHSGPLQEFREKAGFRPNIKLEYADDEGRPLCPKEAFRYLSHKFHGKGPGKNKQEKRIKKAVQEGLMKKMSSTDTPLNTLQLLQDKQRETQSPFIVLSGAKRDAAN